MKQPKKNGAAPHIHWKRNPGTLQMLLLPFGTHFLTITRFRTARSGETMQPRTDLRRRSPAQHHTSGSRTLFAPLAAPCACFRPGLTIMRWPPTTAAPIATEALIARGHEQADAVVGQDTLLHGKALLVLAAHNLEDIALSVAFDIRVKLVRIRRRREAAVAGDLPVP